jgi:hypothetical protein
MTARRLAFFTSLAVFLTLVAAASAAEASRVMVLSFSGGDGAKVQGAVSAALIGAGHDVSPGDTSFDDAAAVIGCDARSDACAEQVLDALSVDEVVYGSSAKNGDIVIVRAARGKPRRQTKARAGAGQTMDAAVAPAMRELYGESAAPPPEPPPPPPAELKAARTRPSPFERGEGEDTVERPYRKWAIVAWSGAGAAAVTGLIFWVRASSLQDDIDRAPDDSNDEIDALEDLEDRAETASTWGNVMMVTAAGLAGAGTYLWMKDRRVRKAPRASIQPTFFPGGAGLLVTIGGDR